MRSSLAFLLGLAMAATAAAQPGGLAQPQVVNGVYTSDYPTVGLLLAGAGPDTAATKCTATLIGCQTLLTAAHCVCDSDGGHCQGDQAPDPGRFWAFLQHAGVVAVESIAVHPSYQFPHGDLAIVRLATPVTAITPTPINRTATPATGTPGAIVGFGRSGLGAQDYGLKRRGGIATAACAGSPDDPTWVCWDFGGSIGAPGTDSNVCNGDSGGPLFTATGCGDELTGVTSGSFDPECGPSDHAFDTIVFTYRDWIAATAGADLDATSCGAVRQLGESGSGWNGFVGSLGPGDDEGRHAVVVPAGTVELRVTMNAVDTGADDFDLYLAHGAAPTTAAFDCADTGSNQFADCVVRAPAAGTWHVMARRKAGNGVYQITVSTIGAGAPDTVGSGSCSDGDACTTADACLRGRCIGATAPDGTACDDGLLCTSGDVCVAGTCAGAATPLPACEDPGARGSALALQSDDADPTRNRLVWRWSRGTIPPGALGSPTTATPYTLCVFDDVGGTPVLRMETTVAPGAGWRAAGRGFRYKDRHGERGGITGITLHGGARGTIKLTGAGPLLGAPALPFAADPHVTVQLSSGAACWQADFATASKNDARRFAAKSE